MKSAIAFSAMVLAANAASPIVLNQQENNILCDLCPAAVNAAVSYVDGLDKDAFNTMIEGACNILPDTLQADCEAIIPLATAELFTLFDSYVTSDNVCGIFCPADQIVSDDNNLLCPECKAAVSWGINWLEGAGEADIQTFIDGLCADLGSLADSCTSVVDTYLPELVNMLDMVDPETVCTDMGSCDSELSLFSSNDLCSDCTAAVDFVENYVSDPDNQTTILNAAHSVCGLFGDEEDTCNSYVDAYGPLVLLELKNLLADSSKVCEDIDLCN